MYFLGACGKQVDGKKMNDLKGTYKMNTCIKEGEENEEERDLLQKNSIYCWVVITGDEYGYIVYRDKENYVITTYEFALGYAYGDPEEGGDPNRIYGVGFFDYEHYEDKKEEDALLALEVPGKGNSLSGTKTHYKYDWQSHTDIIDYTSSFTLEKVADDINFNAIERFWNAKLNSMTINVPFMSWYYNKGFSSSGKFVDSHINLDTGLPLTLEEYESLIAYDIVVEFDFTGGRVNFYPYRYSESYQNNTYSGNFIPFTFTYFENSKQIKDVTFTYTDSFASEPVSYECVLKFEEGDLFHFVMEDPKSHINIKWEWTTSSDVWKSDIYEAVKAAASEAE